MATPGEGKGRWATLSDPARPGQPQRVWIPDEGADRPTPVRPDAWRSLRVGGPEGRWVTDTTSQLPPYHTFRAWVPADQVKAATAPGGALPDGSGAWRYLSSGARAFVSSSEMMRHALVNEKSERVYVPSEPVAYDHETPTGEWVDGKIVGPRGELVTRRVFRPFEPDEHPEAEPCEPGYMTGAQACRTLERSLSWLRAQVARGEVATITTNKRRIMYSRRDVAALARGLIPSHLREAEDAAHVAEMSSIGEALYGGSLAPARSARDLPDPGRSFLERFGKGNGF